MDGRKIFVDSSLVDADASNNSVIDTKNLKHQLEETSESADCAGQYEKKNNRYMFTTDPDASIVNRGKAKLAYQVHRAVDGKNEIITAIQNIQVLINQFVKLKKSAAIRASALKGCSIRALSSLFTMTNDLLFGQQGFGEFSFKRT